VLQRDLRACIGAARPGEIAGWALRLVGAPSPNPPLDTRAAAEEAAAIIRAAPRFRMQNCRCTTLASRR